MLSIKEIELVTQTALNKEELDKQILKCKNPLKLRTLLYIKHERINEEFDSKLDLNFKEICKNDNENIETICELLRVSLVITKNAEKQSEHILIYCLTRIREQSNNSKIVLRMLKIIHEILKYYKVNSNIACNMYEELNMILLILFNCNFEDVTIFINSYIISNYLCLMPSALLIKFINDIFILCMTKQNLSILCNLYNYIHPKNNSSLFNNSEFWEYLSNCIKSDKTYLAKQAIYLLTKSIHIIYLDSPGTIDNTYVQILHSENPLKTWNVYFSLLDISKEKQLHLIQPSLKLLNQIKYMHIIWQKSLYCILVNHSQISVIYTTALEILINATPSNLEIVFNLVLPAINKNELTSKTLVVFFELSNLVRKMDEKQLVDFLKASLMVPWNPTSLWCICYYIFKSDFIEKVPISFYDQIIGLIQKLPNIYIRDGCTNVLHNSIINLKKILTFKEFLKVCQIFLSIDKYPMLTNFVVKQYRKEYLEDIKNVIDFQNKFVDNTFILCLNIIQILKLNICVQYFTNNIDNYGSLLLLQIFNKFPEIFPEKLDKFTKHFPLQDTTIDVNILLRVLKYVDDKNLQEKLSNILMLDPQDLDSKINCDNIYLSFKLLHRENPKYVEILKYWEKIILNGSLKINSKICICFIDKYLSSDYDKNKNIKVIKKILEIIFDSQTDDVIVNTFSKLKYLINIAGNDIENLLELYYSQIKKLKINGGFKDAIKNYIEVIFGLVGKNQNIEFILEKSKLLLELAKTFEVIYYYIALCIHNEVSKHYNENVSNLCIPLLIDIVLQDALIHKEKKVEYAVCQEILNNFKNYRDSPYTVQLKGRTLAIETLYKISKRGNSDTIAKNLLAKYKQFFNKRYFPDSQIYIQKLRICQLLLIFSPQLENEQTALRNFILRSFCEEIHQPCIRQLMQWLLILITKNDVYEQILTIKKTIDGSTKTQPSTIAAFIPVLMHLAVTNQDFYLDVIQILLPYCMGAHFKLRVYSQIAFKILYDKSLKKEFTEVVSKYEFLITSVKQIILASGKAFYDTLGTDLYFFTTLDTQAHFSIKSIFYDIPRHNSVTPVEWENILYSEGFLNIITGLNLFDESFETENTVKEYIEYMEGNNNIQKKITPWKDALQEINNTDSDLILISSLIDKLPNLGGLSRTCEVFGVKNVVLNDVKILNDKEFKSLSMSSENWINTLEVKVDALKDFILEVKSQGYTIIGAEQTAESVMLDKYRFPKKSAILLGNEKEGVPANLIPLLDVCVEIPQQGMVRSLNVHVAGAVFIWEYTKQHFV
ncbi:unnamed protein product [Brassicogethes aeneus]|uniref:tRNA (guanosine(18)-2'-O)-methyltransferase TARBP1 n=1 Tax=Brassicogethes aeneus TaxID=1431903 RepID=A0A9P0FGD4_BRAAE|nr:unnamed protein product [Brassicogethes aeneus]